jgi:hypothetical protein
MISLTFIDNHVDYSHHEVVITALRFCQFKLVSDPTPDGGLNVLKDVFGRRDTTLTKVILEYCNFGTTEDASKLFSSSSYKPNRTRHGLGHFRNP